MLRTVLDSYGINDNEVRFEVFGNGLINDTWKITAAGKQYILQRVNEAVFKRPVDIASNVSSVATYLREYNPQYKFVAPVITSDGEQMVYRKNEGYFRLFPFVLGSRSKNVVETSSEAFEAAAQFGKFTKLLAKINLSDLKTTIPDFHNLSLRYRQFTEALDHGNEDRISKCADLIAQVKNNTAILNVYEQIIVNPEFKLRVTHHDTKISNVLFDESGRGICVIDLDTIMPGYFISDVGDMMRTYLSPVNEEEKDFTKIKIREDFYEAIVNGYCSEMKEELTETEKKYFFYAGKFMIYMQALRFITDHFNNDVYYGAKYHGHNLIRANNQMVLLEQLKELEKK